MPRKPYSPVASYSHLREVEKQLQTVTTADEVRKLVSSHGTKVGYKAFCYLFTGKMTAAAMKPDEACIEAAHLEQQGQADEAMRIYKEVIAVHPEHPIASQKVEAAGSA